MNSHISAAHLAAMPESDLPCPDCQRRLRVGIEGLYCPDAVHCQYMTWIWGASAPAREKAA